jgi:hypothetical protein
MRSGNRTIVGLVTWTAAMLITFAPELSVHPVGSVAQAQGSGSFVVPQQPILDACDGTVTWTPAWGSHFIDASRNCDEDTDRAGVNGPDGVDAMDFDGDCDQDIITGWEENGRVFVYLNPRLRARPVPAGTACPKTYPAASGDDLLIFQQWPFSEVTRDDTNDSRPFRGVEDAIFVDNNNDAIADYLVISTEVGSGGDGRREVFISVPSSVTSTNLPTPAVEWTTFRLTGEENYMRGASGDLNADGCPDIVAGSKTVDGGGTGDIRWWACPSGAGAWVPEEWNGKAKADVPDRGVLRDRWGQHHPLEGKIYWVMEIIVADLETTVQSDGKNYPELLFTDRDTVGYFRVTDPVNIGNKDGWERVTIDEPGKSPFRWMDLGQLTNNGPDGTPGAPEIVVAYNDPDYSKDTDNGVFGRWYERSGSIWHRYDIVLAGGTLPWTYHKDNANKATAFADLDGDGRNEIVASIRGLDYSAVFYLTPPAGRTAEDMRCNGAACSADDRWVIHRISPHFSGGEVKADNLALVDLDLDCDIDVASVDENFGANQRGLGVSWYSNPIVQQGFPCNRAPAFVTPDLSTLLADEGTAYTRDFTVSDADDSASALTVALAPGSPGVIVKQAAPGLWTWRYTPADGVANPSTVKVGVIVSDGWTNGTATVDFDVLVRNVAPTITSMQANPASVFVGKAVSINVTSTDPAGPADSYTCHLDFDDGTTAAIAAPGGTCTTTHSFSVPGQYTIAATVADEDGGVSAGLSSTVDVVNPPPVVAVPTLTPAAPGPLREGGALRVRATFTDEAPSGPYACRVDFGDGNVVTFAAGEGFCETGLHAYADDGTYTVRVEVTDKYSVTGASSVSAVIANVAPVITASAASINEDGVATIGGSILDPGVLDSQTVTVAWGDGRTTSLTYPAGTTSWSMGIRYLDDNPTGTPSDTYAVNVTALDDGAVPGVAATTVIVANVAPVVTLAAMADEFGNPLADGAIVLQHTTIALGASFSDVGSLDTHSASVSWGDGAADPLTIESFEMTGTHVFTAPGVRLVTLNVVDDDTGVGTATRQLEVVDAAGAVARLVEQLRQRLQDPGTPPATRAVLQRVVAELDGQRSGRAANGALDLIAAGAWQAALVKLRRAVVDLDNAGLEYESMLLVLSARSLLIELIADAARRPDSAAEAAAIVQSIDPALPRPEQIDACMRALVVLRPALG